MGNSKAFPTVLSLGTALVFFAFIGTALAAPDNSWQGTAMLDNVKVYVDPSAASRVVTILTRGVHVNVLVEIEVLGIQWCRVQVPSENERLGYAHCTDIQRPASQVNNAVHKQPIAIATPAPAVAVPIVLERRAEQPSAPTTSGSITSVRPTTAASTDALTNGDILSMSKAGLPADVLVAKIKSTSSNFNTSPNALQQAKTSGVADSVILAMVQAPIASSDPVTTELVTTNSAAPDSAATMPRASALTPPDISTVSTIGSRNSKAMIKVEIVQQTESLDTIVRGAGLVGAIAGNRRHEVVFQVNALIDGEHARLECYEHQKGCTAIGPGMYDAELKNGNKRVHADIWILVVIPVKHAIHRDHWVVSGTW